MSQKSRNHNDNYTVNLLNHLIPCLSIIYRHHANSKSIDIKMSPTILWNCHLGIKVITDKIIKYNIQKINPGNLNSEGKGKTVLVSGGIRVIGMEDQVYSATAKYLN